MAKESKESREIKESKEEKRKALDAAILQIEKQYGTGSVMRLGDAGNHMNVATVPTGSLSLDLALGLGGLPKGRIIEIYGPESSGKTTVALHVVAEVQRSGGIAAFIDAEHALDPAYARKIGVQIEDLYISQPDNGEQALEITETMVRSGAVDIVIVDSVMFGNPETTTGGRALKFYSSIRMDVRKIETLKQGGVMVGNRTRIKVVKNKIAPPFKEAEFDIMFGEGISREGDILDIAANIGIVSKSGAWYAYEGEKIGQGRENAKQLLKDRPELCEEIDQKVRAHYEAVRKEEAEKAAAEAAAKANRAFAGQTGQTGSDMAGSSAADTAKAAGKSEAETKTATKAAGQAVQEQKK